MGGKIRGEGAKGEKANLRFNCRVSSLNSSPSLLFPSLPQFIAPVSSSGQLSLSKRDMAITWLTKSICFESLLLEKYYSMNDRSRREEKKEKLSKRSNLFLKKEKRNIVP